MSGDETARGYEPVHWPAAFYHPDRSRPALAIGRIAAVCQRCGRGQMLAVNNGRVVPMSCAGCGQ